MMFHATKYCYSHKNVNVWSSIYVFQLVGTVLHIVISKGAAVVRLMKKAMAVAT